MHGDPSESDGQIEQDLFRIDEEAPTSEMGPAEETLLSRLSVSDQKQLVYAIDAVEWRKWSKRALEWGNDLGIGADILRRISPATEFEQASGKYVDNDAASFGAPPSDALNLEKVNAVVDQIETMLKV